MSLWEAKYRMISAEVKVSQAAKDSQGSHVSECADDAIVYGHIQETWETWATCNNKRDHSYLRKSFIWQQYM